MRVRAALVVVLLTLAAPACDDDDPGSPDAGPQPDAANRDGADSGASSGLMPPWRDERCTVWTQLPPLASRAVAASDNEVLFLDELGVAKVDVPSGIWTLQALPVAIPSSDPVEWQTRGSRHAFLWKGRVFTGDAPWAEVLAPGAATVTSLALGPEGDLYLGTAEGPVLRRHGQDWTTLPATPRGQPSLWATADRLYQGSDAGVRVLQGGQWTNLTLPVAAAACRVWGVGSGAVHADCAGSLLQLEGAEARFIPRPTCDTQGPTTWGIWGGDLVMATSCGTGTSGIGTTSLWRRQGDQWTALPVLTSWSGQQVTGASFAGSGDRLYGIGSAGVQVLRNGQWSDVPDVAAPIGTDPNLRNGDGAIAAAADGTLYAGGVAGLFRQEAGGSWQPLPGTAAMNVIELWPAPDGTIFFAAKLPSHGVVISRYRDGTVHRDLELPPLQVARPGVAKLADFMVSRFAGLSDNRVFLVVSGDLYTWNGSDWSKGPMVCLPAELTASASDLAALGPELVTGDCPDSLWDVWGAPAQLTRLGMKGRPVPLASATPAALVLTSSPAGARLRTAAGWSTLELPPSEGLAITQAGGVDADHLALFTRTGLLRVINGGATAPIPYPAPFRPAGRGFWSDGRRAAFAGAGKLGVCDFGPW